MQANVSICTKESDLIIKYGPNKVDTQPRELAFSSVKYIYTDYCDLQTYYIRLGFHLSEFENFGYYRDFGFSDLHSFVKENLGMDKTSLSRCINVFRRFCAKKFDYTGCLTTRCNRIDPEYKEYSYSQLCEMVSMNDDLIKKCSPGMTVKEIRELKKNDKSKCSCDVATKSFDFSDASDRFDFVNDLVDIIKKKHGDVLKSFSFDSNIILFSDDQCQYEISININKK